MLCVPRYGAIHFYNDINSTHTVQIVFDTCIQFRNTLLFEDAQTTSVWTCSLYDVGDLLVSVI